MFYEAYAGPFSARDLVAKKDLGTFDDGVLSLAVKPHDAFFL